MTQTTQTQNYKILSHDEKNTARYDYVSSKIHFYEKKSIKCHIGFSIFRFLEAKISPKWLGKKPKKFSVQKPFIPFVKTIKQSLSNRIDQTCHGRLRHFSLLSRCVRSLELRQWWKMSSISRWCFCWTNVVRCSTFFGGRGMYMYKTNQNQTSSKSNNGCLVGCKMI